MPMRERAGGQCVAYATVPILLHRAELGWQDVCWGAEGLKGKGR